MIGRVVCAATSRTIRSVKAPPCWVQASRAAGVASAAGWGWTSAVVGDAPVGDRIEGAAGGDQGPALLRDYLTGMLATGS